MTVTTRETIRAWVKRAPSGTTHMIVACDTYDWEDYPIYVKPTEKVREVAARQQKVMEVYNLKADLEPQIAAARVFNYD